MISEQDKQAILNGAYAITRNGRKAKYIGTYASNDYPYYFIFLDEDGDIVHSTALTKYFKEYENASSEADIVGLWQDKPEPKTVILTLPCPVLNPEISKTYYTPIITDVDGYDPDGHFSDIAEWVVDDEDGHIDWQSQRRLEEGLVFETKEDAQAWLDAMRNNRR